MLYHVEDLRGLLVLCYISDNDVMTQTRLSWKAECWVLNAVERSTTQTPGSLLAWLCEGKYYRNIYTHTHTCKQTVRTFYNRLFSYIEKSITFCLQWYIIHRKIHDIFGFSIIPLVNQLSNFVWSLAKFSLRPSLEKWTISIKLHLWNTEWHDTAQFMVKS